MPEPPRSTPFAQRDERFAAGTLGIWLFLVSLGVLFAATVVGYFVVRYSAGAEATADLPALPRALWLSTLILLISSGSMHIALLGVRAGRPGQLRFGLLATTLLGFGFLAMQVLCWTQWAGPLAEAIADSQARFIITGFYVLTGIHGLHVIGGIVPLTIVALRSWRGVYEPSYYPGVRYCAMYWHFLDAVWLTLFITLLLGTM